MVSHACTAWEEEGEKMHISMLVVALQIALLMRQQEVFITFTTVAAITEMRLACSLSKSSNTRLSYRKSNPNPITLVNRNFLLFTCFFPSYDDLDIPTIRDCATSYELPR